jgi:hypothetical protein
MTNVVHMTTPHAALPPVLAAAWDPIKGALEKAWESWAQESDDVLFRRSEQGEEANDFFEGMRLLRRNRPVIERDFWNRLRRNTDQWLRESSPVFQAPVGPAILSLVENADLEESLAVTAMGERGERDAGAQWTALTHRLAHALHLNAESRADLPFSPLAIAAAFRLSLDQLDGMTVPVRLILLKLFERHAWNPISLAVTEANDGLRQKGILPHLSAAPPRVSRPPAEPREPAAPRSPEQGGTSAASHPPRDHGGQGMALPAELMEMLASLKPWVQARQAIEGEHASPPLRGEAFASSGSPADQGYGESPTMLHPSQWRHAVLDRLPSASRHHDHEQAIDLVAMVFEFLLKDSALPLPVQALLGRLQLPYLRVAVLDPHEFAQNHHPARQLLDTLSQTGQAWSEAEDPRGQRFELLRMTVHRLHEAADDDLNIFAQENDAWKTRLTQESKRQEQFEQRTVQVQEGQDRRLAAQREVATALTDRLSELNLPVMVRSLLNQHWGTVLTLLWLRHGPKSSEYRRAILVIDQVKYVSQAILTPQGLATALRMSSGIGPALKNGWALLGLDEATVEKMTHAVLVYVADRLKQPAPPAPSTRCLWPLTPISRRCQKWLPGRGLNLKTGAPPIEPSCRGSARSVGDC